MEQNVGLRPREVIVTKKQYEHLKKMCADAGLSKPGEDVGPSQVYGLDITVVPDDGAQPPIQIVQPSRRRGPVSFAQVDLVVNGGIIVHDEINYTLTEQALKMLRDEDFARHFRGKWRP